LWREHRHTVSFGLKTQRKEVMRYCNNARSGFCTLFRFATRWLAAFAAVAVAPSAFALPSFAQQTGQPCSTCHVGAFGPQLTPFGRSFKLGGYTLAAPDSNSIPLAAMLVASYTHTKADQPDNAGPHDGPNDNFSLQEASVFLAGRLSDHIGSFAQITYSDIDRLVTLDNVDVRYAHPLQIADKPAILGVSVNNNPTVSDVWNTVPAWRFPYMASELVPEMAAAPLIDGGLEHQVLGGQRLRILQQFLVCGTRRLRLAVARIPGRGQRRGQRRQDLRHCTVLARRLLA
jgi:hypothetical protein